MAQPSVVHRALDAIERGDSEAIEALRGQLRPVHLDGLLLKWSPGLPWARKDGWIHLLMDQPDRRLRKIWEDGLDSPTVENRAVSVAWLTPVRFEDLLRDGVVDPGLVEAAIALHRGQPPRQALSTSPAVFELTVGPGQGEASARPRRTAERVSPGVVAMRLHRVQAPLGLPELRVRLSLAGQLLTDSRSPIPAGHTTLYKSWRLQRPGVYRIEVSDPRSGEELAAATFTVG